MILNILSLVILAILLAWIGTDITMAPKSRRRLQLCVALAMVVVCAELGCTLTDNMGPKLRWASACLNTVGFAVSPFVFLVESQFYSATPHKRRVLLFAPAVFNAFLALFSPFSHVIFYVTEDGMYHRGMGFFVYLAVFAYSVLASIYKKVRALSQYPSYFRARILQSGVVLLLGIGVQTAFPQFHTSWILITFYLVLYYALACELGSLLDGLTRLMNRNAFNKLVQHFPTPGNRVGMLFMIDVDDFKAVNDSKGHSYGDFCLREISLALLESFGKIGQVFRFGGDEFSVLALLRDESSAQRYVEKLNARLAQRREKYPDFPTLSVGYAVFDHRSLPREIIDLADEHMYDNKRSNKELGDALREDGRSKPL